MPKINNKFTPTRNMEAYLKLFLDPNQTLSKSEIAKQIDLQTNLVFYHLKNLQERHLVIETEDKKYTCQPIFTGDTSEDLEALTLLMIKTIAREIIIEDPTETTLSDAVIENLRAYVKVFEIETE